MYENELKELGLTDNEIKIYLALLKNKILNPTQLAEKTGLHRSYIYDTLQRLLEQGIINTIIINGKKNFQAVNPNVLKQIFELKLKHLDEILPALSSIYNSNKEEIKVELHKGKRVFRTFLQDVISNLKNNDVVNLIGIDETVLEKIEPIYLKQYFNIIKEKNVKEKLIIAKGKKKFENPRLEYKEIDPRYIGNTAIAVYGNKVYLFITGEPHNLIIIENKSVADTYRKQFNLFWSI